MNAQVQPRVRTEEGHRSFADLIDEIAIRADDERIAFRRIRAQIDTIRRWYVQQPGWTVIETRDMIRVVKTAAHIDSTQGLPWALLPLDYEVLVWVLRYEEAGGDSPQFVCSELIREIEEQSARTAGEAHFSWDRYDHRRALVRVFNALLDMGALRRIDGNLEDYDGDTRNDGLYEFTGVARHLHVHVPLDLEAAIVAGDLGRLTAHSTVPARQRLYRALLLKPVFYRFEDPEAFALLDDGRTREQVRGSIDETFGWHLEVTPAYAALLRPAGFGMRQAFPRAGTAIMHVVLLFCLRLRDLVSGGALTADAMDRVTMTRGRFLAELVRLRDAHGSNWGKALGDPGKQVGEIAAELIVEMKQWRMAEVPDDETVRFLPICARYVGYYTAEPIATFDDGEEAE